MSYFGFFPPLRKFKHIFDGPLYEFLDHTFLGFSKIFSDHHMTFLLIFQWWTALVNNTIMPTTTHYPYVMSCPLPTMGEHFIYHSKNNTTTLIICPILFLTPCPALAHHG